MENNTLLSKLLNGTFLTAIVFVIIGVLTIIDPGYIKAKWGDTEWTSQLIVGGGYIIIGSIIIIVKGISIYKSYKKDKNEY